MGVIDIVIRASGNMKMFKLCCSALIQDEQRKIKLPSRTWPLKQPQHSQMQSLQEQVREARTVGCLLRQRLAVRGTSPKVRLTRIGSADWKAA